ncbi:hypothetical protein ABIB73_006885 [Bradyrhizobium sp. F1.4.3]
MKAAYHKAAFTRYGTLQMGPPGGKLRIGRLDVPCP